MSKGILVPMLAATPESFEDLFPNTPGGKKKRYRVSRKIDGFRAWKPEPFGKALSRSNKDLRNAELREKLNALQGYQLDGELFVEGASFNEVQGYFTREDAPLPEGWAWHIFDTPVPGIPFEERLEMARKAVEEINLPYIKFVEHREIDNLADLEAYANECLAQGYEGAMVRSPEGMYKFGRATANEGTLLKWKPFADGEAVILGFEEQMENTNPKETNELGRSKRSSAKAGKVGKDTLGKFHVRDCVTGVEFEIGTGEGLTERLRKRIWEARDSYIGKIVHYRYQKEGMKDKPRLPIWFGFRDESDMS
jgi:DNA ligase-1